MPPTVEELFRRGVAAGQIAAEDAERFLAKYREMLGSMDEAEARKKLLLELEAEASRRKISANVGLRALSAYRDDPDKGRAAAKRVSATFYEALGGEDPKLLAKPPTPRGLARPIERIGLLVMILGAALVACGAYYYVGGYNSLGRYVEKIWRGPFEAVRMWQRYNTDGAVAFGWLGLLIALVGAILAFGYDRVILPVVTWVRTGRRRPPR